MGCRSAAHVLCTFRLDGKTFPLAQAKNPDGQDCKYFYTDLATQNTIHRHYEKSSRLEAAFEKYCGILFDNVHVIDIVDNILSSN